MTRIQLNTAITGLLEAAQKNCTEAGMNMEAHQRQVWTCHMTTCMVLRNLADVLMTVRAVEDENALKAQK